MLAILLIPSALVYSYGSIVKAKKHAWIVWGVMLFLFLGGLGFSLWSEYSLNPVTGIAGEWREKKRDSVLPTAFSGPLQPRMLRTAR